MRHFIIAFVVTAGLVHAADLYMTPEGAGTKDGANWNNALSYSAEKTGLQRAWDALPPGGTLHLGIGDYSMKPLLLAANGKTKADIRTLSGVVKDGKMPTFTGTWAKATPGEGPDFITIKNNSSWWAIENIAIRHAKVAIGCESLGRVANGRIENVQVDNMREGIVLNGGAAVLKPEIGTHDVLIKNCRFTNYTKRGIRMRNGCYDIRVEGCRADAGGKEYATEAFHMGYSIEGGGEGVFDHDITYVGCVARNNYNDNGKGYWNADGFCAEAGTYNLTYLGCRAYDNTDGGWDIKSANPLLIGCVAMRNKKNYRFWAKEPGAVLLRCISAHSFKRGGNSNPTGLWTRGKVRIFKSSFVEPTLPFDINNWRLKAGEYEQMGIKLVDSIVTMDVAKKDKRIVSQNVSFIPLAGKKGEAAAYASPVEGRDKDDPGTAYDSVEFGPERGYHSSWNTPAVLKEGRALQPRVTREAKPLPLKILTVYQDRRPSGWYLTGWKGGRTTEVRGRGRDGSTCLAFSSKDGGGAAYRTKRMSAKINTGAREAADWTLRFHLLVTKGSRFDGAKINVYDIDTSIKTRDIPIPAELGGSNNRWQQIDIPLSKFLVDPGSKIEGFAGISIRPASSNQLLIDDISLIPTAKQKAD